MEKQIRRLNLSPPFAHLRTAPKFVLAFLVSRVSVSLSSAAAAAAAAAAAFLFFFDVDPFVVVAEVGVAEPLSLLFPANEPDSGVGAAGVELADAGVIASCKVRREVSLLCILRPPWRGMGDGPRK